MLAHKSTVMHRRWAHPRNIPSYKVKSIMSSFGSRRINLNISSAKWVSFKLTIPIYQATIPSIMIPDKVKGAVSNRLNIELKYLFDTWTYINFLPKHISINHKYHYHKPRSPIIHKFHTSYLWFEMSILTKLTALKTNIAAIDTL